MAEEYFRQVSNLVQNLLKKRATIVVEIDILTDFKKHLEHLLSLSAASAILNDIGIECGMRYCSRTESKTRLSGEKLLDHIAKEKLEERWGGFEFAHVDLARKQGYIAVRDSFEARNYGPSRVPACHFLRGFLGGLLSRILGERIAVEERKCLAKGDPRCEFYLRPI